MKLKLKLKRLTKDQVVGKQVIDLEATLIGTVTDLSFDLESNKIDLVVTTKAGTLIDVLRKDIGTVGDVILLNKKVKIPDISVATKPQPQRQSPKTPGLCSACGYQNEASSKFCMKCGSKL